MRIEEVLIKEIDTYLNGLGSDYDSVINVIKFDYNNGLAEGRVNKLKNIKRVMYGRNSFELLRHKVIKLEKLRKFGDL